MAHQIDNVSIGSDGYFVTDGPPTGVQLLSGGIFREYVSPGSTRAIALFTDGYFENAGNDQTAEVIFSHGVYRGCIAGVPPTGGVASVLRHYMELMHY